MTIKHKINSSRSATDAKRRSVCHARLAGPYSFLARSETAPNKIPNPAPRTNPTPGLPNAAPNIMPTPAPITTPFLTPGDLMPVGSFESSLIRNPCLRRSPARLTTARASPAQRSSLRLERHCATTFRRGACQFAQQFQNFKANVYMSPLRGLSS